MDGLFVMGWAYAVLALVVVVGIIFPTRRTAALVKLAFVLALSVVLLVIVWYGAHMAFYYFNGGVVSE